jgi:hypothetical protein
MNDSLTLRKLPLGARIGIGALVAVLLGGLCASGLYMKQHHEVRDGEKGLTMTDLEGAYHGVRATAPLVLALERNHPEGLGEADRKVLSDWLGSNRITEDYDNLDLGESAPAEILDMSCLECHSRNSSDRVASALPLEYWDDVKKLAFSREIEPADPKVLLASTHAHSLALSIQALVLALLALLTRFSRKLISGVLCVAGISLAVDIAGWWLARGAVAWVPALVAGGALFAATNAFLAVLVLLDLMLPDRSQG